MKNNHLSIKNNQIDAKRQFCFSYPMLTPAQCRAARGLLDWTQQDLADAAHIGVATVRLFEGEGNVPRYSTIALLQQALVSAGVEFIAENGGGAGVRLQKRRSKRSK